MIVQFEVDDDTVAEVLKSIERHSGIRASLGNVEAFLSAAAKDGIAFVVEEGLDETVDLWIKQN